MRMVFVGSAVFEWVRHVLGSHASVRPHKPLMVATATFLEIRMELKFECAFAWLVRLSASRPAHAHKKTPCGRHRRLRVTGKFPNTQGKPGCTETEGACGCWCTNGTNECVPGQSCFWFSQGCTIGCKTCNGTDGSARWQKDLCNSGAQATLCDPRLRTYNMDAPCNSESDLYRWNPWRHPGNAPVFDACGRAGGGITGGKVGGGAAFYTDTVHAKEGDMGSKVLPPMPSGIVYKSGSTFEATWGMRANHGGGTRTRTLPPLAICSPVVVSFIISSAVPPPLP